MTEESKTSSSNPFIEMIEIWIRAKKLSIQSNDWSYYKEVLELSIKNLSGLFANAKKEWFIKIVGDMIRTATCELKEINIKYKEQRYHPSNKDET